MKNKRVNFFYNKNSPCDAIHVLSYPLKLSLVKTILISNTRVKDTLNSHFSFSIYNQRILFLFFKVFYFCFSISLIIFVHVNENKTCKKFW